ncbi:hypothetical protein [Pseudoxanthomonas sacheonensis]|uniref:Lipoprotein n=1 Tax=Pseudoxanthomonas sacheonensis TaxID=443615 RepID=A0ABU1RT00_9GAMM|nr:hypothetical protein [Pseudoxanthomonas sacheonensis]MDR6841900.1 hypothetical protein [Pseudoxanthomonas sacheonensis]
MSRWILLALPLCGLLLLAACEQEPAAPRPATSGPAGAVQQLVQRLHENDLAGFARAAVPPADYARLETAWREGRSRWPLTELPLDDQLEPMLSALAAPDSERQLQQAFKRNFANQDKDLKDAARSLGLFGVQYVKREGVFTDEERAHYAQMIQALSEWAQKAPLSDSRRGLAAIPPLVAAARKTGLTDEESFRAAGMTGSLQRLSPFFAQAKTLLAGYGLSLDRSFSELRTEVVEQKGDQARVRVHYTLGDGKLDDREIDTVVSLERRAGRWYLTDYLRHAEQALAPPAEEASESQIGPGAQVPPPASGSAGAAVGAASRRELFARIH